MTAKIAFLLGAGASKAIDSMKPSPPPLGNELYPALASRIPETWGSLPEDLVELFADGFEVGMAETWGRNVMGSRLLVDMGVFFARFQPPRSGDDLYSGLIRSLISKKLVSSTVIATLNYECALDVAAARQGLRVNDLGAAPTPNSLRLLKLHGACNLLPGVADQFQNFSIVGESYYEGPLRSVDLLTVLVEYHNGSAIPPAMSVFMPSKHSPVAPESIRRSRAQWSESVATCELIVCVGARPLLSDEHVWSPILASDAPILYIGGNSDGNFADFQAAVGERLSVIETRFTTAGLNELSARLSTL